MKGVHVMEGLVMRTAWLRLATGAALIGLLAATGLALGQSLKEQIIGAWQYVSIYNEDGGLKKHIYGEKPLGLVVFDRSGYVIGYLSKPDLPKFAANNRLKGTDEEYREAMQGMLAGFGTYSIDGDTVTINWIGSSYPNRAGTIEKRTYTVTGDEMTAINPTASSGGTSVANFRRVK
jgi:hypothetical protein